MLIDAHVHIFPNVNGYGPKGHTHGEGYGRIDAGDGIAQDVLPAINEKTSHTLQMLLHEMRQGQVDKAVLILCPCYGDWSEYVLQACRDYPEQFTASAFFDPWRPAARQYYTEKLDSNHRLRCPCPVPLRVSGTVFRRNPHPSRRFCHSH